MDGAGSSAVRQPAQTAMMVTSTCPQATRRSSTGLRQLEEAIWASVCRQGWTAGICRATRPHALPGATAAAPGWTNDGGGVDSHYSLVIAAAQAAGPCPPGAEGGRPAGHGDLRLPAPDRQQARQRIQRLAVSREPRSSSWKNVDPRQSSRAAPCCRRQASSEPIRTEQRDTYRGQALIEPAGSKGVGAVDPGNQRTQGSGTVGGCWR